MAQSELEAGILIGFLDPAASRWAAWDHRREKKKET
jgi:hypothetical protein